MAVSQPGSRRVRVTGQAGWQRWSEPLLAGLLLLMWLKVAWASDDAYIYFRSVEMWYAGYGPVYNPGWRVQAFTSPLWYGLLVWGRAWLANVYLVAMAWSLVLSAWVWWRLRTWAPSPGLRWLVALTALASIGFFDYTSSGLETPLLYAVLVALLWAWEHERWGLAWFALAALALTRYDVAAFLASPVAAVVAGKLWRARRAAGRRWLLAGAGVVLAWLGFALVYYGTPLPNPVYAKVLAGIPRREVLRQGLGYYLAHVAWDPITLLVVALGTMAWWQVPRGRAWALGLLLYGLYLVWVGGDFMLGRFLAPGFLVALIGLLRWVRIRARPGIWQSVWAGLVLGYHVGMPYTPLTTGLLHEVPPLVLYGVIDERGRYHMASSLLHYGLYVLQGEPYPFFPLYGWSYQGYSVRHGSIQVALVYSIGMFGYWAGPEKTVVDLYALVDPFLARLPDADGRIWRPGHLERPVPPGYLATLVTGENRLQDPQHRALWEQVDLVTRGPLWSRERWRAIPAFALGLHPEPRGATP